MIAPSGIQSSPTRVSGTEQGGAGSPPGIVTWPAERFYWAVSETAGLKRPGVLPPGLVPDLEREAPVPVNTLHAVAAPMGDGRVLICAATVADLEGLPRDTATLQPAHLPELPGAEGFDPAALNLLTGRFEPIAQRRRRHRLLAAAALSAVLTLALVWVGLARRQRHWDSVAEAAAQAMRDIAAARLNGISPEQVPERLVRLRALSDAVARAKPGLDASARLADLLSVWPVRDDCWTQSLSISESGGAVGEVIIDADSPSGIAAAGPGGATGFLNALRAPGGDLQIDNRWKIEEPRIASARGSTRITVRMRPPALNAKEGP